MKRFLPLAALVCASTLTGIPAIAQSSAPQKGAEFMCFPGMDVSALKSEAASAACRIARGPKLGDSKFDNTDGHDLREVTTEGDYHVPVILVAFADKKFARDDESIRALVNDMLNGENFTYNGATGSANQFYRTTSRGQFNPIFDVYGPVTVSKPEVDYVTSNPDDTYIDENGSQVTCYPAGRMVEEAIKLLDDRIDYSKYDANNDGMVDFVYLFHAGQGATTGGSSKTTIWPHAFTLNAAIGSALEMDGVQVNRYATSSELGNDKKLSGIGTFCHEFAHVLGLPDLYDTKNNNGRPSECFTPGSFDCMDAGNYNNSEHTPPVFSSYEQYALEWVKPVTLPGAGRYTLLPFECHPLSYKVNTISNPQEYFLFENRGESYYDKYMSGHGMLVWHIDFNLDVWNQNVVNNTASHMRIDLIEADGMESDNTRNGDPFPGVSTLCEFLPNLAPAFNDWNKKSTGYEIREIVQNFDGTVSFLAKADGTQKVEDAPETVPAPEAKLCGADANSLYVEWNAVKGATEYFVSVFDASAFDGGVLPASAYADGYYFMPLDPERHYIDGAGSDVLGLRIEGLKSNARYGVMIYASDDVNASRMAEPIFASTVDGADFGNARTNLYLERAADDVLLSWDAVEGADSYEVKVSTLAFNDSESTIEVNFDNTLLPEGWTGNAKYDTRSFGAASPSYRFTQNDAFLQSPLFEEQISEVSFWCRRSYEEDLSTIYIYGADSDGNWTLYATDSDISGVKAGGMKSFTLPAGVHGVRIGYSFASTGLDFYLDDMKLTLHKNVAETPAVCDKVFTSPTSACVSGLKSGVEYQAIVTPCNADGYGANSNPVLFSLENLPASGVTDILPDASQSFRLVGNVIVPTDANAEYSVYTAEGITIAAGAKGNFTLPARGIYIIRINGTSAKIRL